MDNTILFWGKVIKGKRRGKSRGYPTANIELHRNVTHGIYISKAIVSQKEYFALTFIGSNKTFNEHDIKAETYFINAKPNVYGKWLTVKLLKKIRDNKKFKSTKELITQMKKDLIIAKIYFKI